MIELQNYSGLNGEDYVPQPFYAHVDVYVDNIKLTGGGVEDEDPGIGGQLNFTLIEFEHSQDGANMAHSFTMKLFDKYWIDIEQLLLLGNAEVRFQKYYMQAGGTERINASPMYGGTVSTWDTSFTSAGTLITVECIGFLGANRTQNFGSFGGQVLYEEKLETRNAFTVTDIVRKVLKGELDSPEAKIAKGKVDDSGSLEGWVADVVDCKNKPSLSALRTSEGDWGGIYAKYGRNDMRFLAYLVQYADPVEGEEPYRFWMTQKSVGSGVDAKIIKTVHFRPFTLEDKKKVGRTFTYLYGFENSEVIDFNPKMNVDLFTSTSGIEAAATTFSTVSKNAMLSRTSDTKLPKTIGSVVGNLKTTVQSAYALIGDTVGATGYMSPRAYEDVALATAASQYLWDVYSVKAYEATLTIVGYGENALSPFENIEIYVLTNPDVINNPNATDRLVHPSSGIYRIESINDTINGGSWTITFNLIRTGPLALNDMNSGRFKTMSTGGQSQVQDLQVHGHGKDVPVAAGSGAPAVASDGSLLAPPVPCGKVVSAFETENRPDHHGIDIQVDNGTPITFPTDVEVVTVHEVTTSYVPRSGKDRGGSYIVVRDPKTGKTHWYFHLSEIPSYVKPGETITGGTILALSGGIKGAPGSGNAEGPHLHYEVKGENGKPIDPDIVTSRPQPCP